MKYSRKLIYNNKSLFLFPLVTVLILLVPTIVQAQLFELEVNETEATGPVPVFRDHQGKTGVIVKSSQTNLQFESNLEIIDERSNPEEGTYRIIIEPVNQYLSVSAPGFMTSRVHLTNLEPNEVIYYSIEPLSFSDDATSEQTFQEIRNSGIQLFNEEDYYFALDRFNDALRLRPDNIEVTRYKLQAEDEIAWNDAKIIDTIEAYQNYLNGTTIKQYADSARNAMMKKRFTLGEAYANNNNVQLAEEHLQTYLDDYPAGPDFNNAKNILCDLYESNGDSFALDEDLNGMKNAVDYYKKADSVCDNSPDLNNKIHKTEILHARYSNPRIGYTNFTHDRKSSYGITFGTLNYFKRAGYFTLRFNEGVFTRGGRDFTVDSEGNINPPETIGSVEHTGEIRKGNAEMIVGINYPVYFPFWAYAGIGYSYNPTFWEMNDYTSSGSLQSTDWIRNTDSSTNGIVFEFGAIAFVDIVGINLSLGVKSYSFPNFIPTISFGFISK